jgi:2,4-dichlorophenol 6-monooxygenase
MADSSASVADVTGADGARSRVLTEAGLTFEGPDDPGRYASIWLRADLARFST